jgi:hypothetical protein
MYAFVLFYLSLPSPAPLTKHRYYVMGICLYAYF